MGVGEDVDTKGDLDYEYNVVPYFSSGKVKRAKPERS